MFLVTITVKNPHAKPFCMVITAPTTTAACAQAKRQFKAPDSKGATFSAQVFLQDEAGALIRPTQAQADFVQAQLAT